MHPAMITIGELRPLLLCRLIIRTSSTSGGMSGKDTASVIASNSVFRCLGLSGQIPRQHLKSIVGGDLETKPKLHKRFHIGRLTQCVYFISDHREPRNQMVRMRNLDCAIRELLHHVPWTFAGLLASSANSSIGPCPEIVAAEPKEPTQRYSVLPIGEKLLGLPIALGQLGYPTRLLDNRTCFGMLWPLNAAWMGFPTERRCAKIRISCGSYR